MHSKVQRWTIQISLVVLALAIACPPAWALSLREAKAQGLVGEQPNGYLGAVEGQPSSEVGALIASVNQQRRQRYQEIAARNDTDLTAVEILAGQTALKKTKPGHYIQLPSGEWAKK
jgi:uncharacterized protein